MGRLILVPWLILAAALGTTWLVWDHERHSASREVSVQLDFALREASNRVEQRMAAYEQTLRGIQALFIATGAMDRTTFPAYVRALQLDANYSGILGIGTIARATGGQVMAPVTQIEPDGGRNRLVAGFDAWDDPVPRQALETARDSGMAAISGKLRLATDGESETAPVFIMVLPVYPADQPHDSLAQRRAHLIGWVFALLSMNDLMASLYGEPPSDLAFTIFDGVEPAEARILFRSDGAGPATAIAGTEYLVVAARTWTLSMRALDGFASRFGRGAPRLIAVGGTGLSLLLALLAWSMATSRARALQLAALMTSELRESEQRWAFALEGAGDGVWDWNLRTRTAVTSRRWNEIVGCAGDDSGTIDAWEERIHPDDRQAVVAAMLHGLNGTADGRTTWVSEYRIRDNDGTWKWVMSRGMVIEFDDDHRPLRIIGTITDIAERKATEERLHAAMVTVSESNRAKMVFLAMMSHEIRTPMTGILGMARLVLEEPLPPATRENMTVLKSSAEGLLVILDDILDISKLEIGHLQFERKSFHLPKLIAGVVSLMAPRAADKGLSLSSDIAAGLPIWVAGDVTRLRQVLVNLISNAVKFTETGSVSLRIAPAGTENIEFSVTDTGIGLAEDVKPRLFQSFTQADSSISRRFGGTGLGLSICKRLIEAQGGEIGVDSQPGQGSRFWFRLALPPAEAPAAPPAAASALPSLAILLAEDNPVNAKVIRAILSRAGHRVTVVGDGQAAVDAAGSERFDAVLMDMQMPIMDGLTATHEIRRLGAPYSAVPIIALTANAFSIDRERCLAAGMDGYLSKPVDRGQLEQELARHVRVGERVGAALMGADRPPGS